MPPPPARTFPPLTPHPQYLDNVINNSTSYANAYFEINYIRAFGVNASVVVDSSGSAVGTGGLCGSAFLNYRFEEHVRGRLGRGRFDEMKLKKGKTWQMGLRYFEEFVKRNFNEDEHQEINIP